MRFFNTQQVARPAPIDRNPINRTLSGSASSAAPHATTIRFSYTVPANRKATCQAARAAVQRNTAATTPGAVQSAIRYQPNAGALFAYLNANVVTNGVNDVSDQSLPSMGDMLAGDYIDGEDADGSTGGTTSPSQAIKIFEYDA